MPEAPPWPTAEPAVRSRLVRVARGQADPAIEQAAAAVSAAIDGVGESGPATVELLTVGFAVRLLAAGGERGCALPYDAAVCGPLAAALALRATGAPCVDDPDLLRAALSDAVAAALPVAAAAESGPMTAAALGAARLVAGAVGARAAERHRAERAAVALSERVLTGGPRPARVDVALAAGSGARAARRARAGARAAGRAPVTGQVAALRDGDPALLGNLPPAGRCPWTVGPLRAVRHALELLPAGRVEPVRVDVGVSPAAFAHVGSSGDPASCDLRAAVAGALALDTEGGSLRQLIRRVFVYEHAACDAAIPYQAGAVVTVRARGGHRVTFRAAPGGTPDPVLASDNGSAPWPVADDAGADPYARGAAELLDHLARGRPWRLTG